MQETHETQVWSLGQEEPLEEGMAIQLQYSCPENPVDRGALEGYSPRGYTEWDSAEAAEHALFHSFIYLFIYYRIDSWGYGGQEVPWPANCQTENRKANSIIQSETNGPRTEFKRLKTRSCSVQGLEERDVSVQVARLNLPFLCYFVLFRPSVGGTMPTFTDENSLFCSVCGFKCSFLLETPSHTHLEVLIIPAIWASLSPPSCMDT